MSKKPLDLNLTPELLGLDNIKIDNIYLSNDGTIHINVSSTQLTVLCRQCHSPTGFVKTGSQI